MPGSRMGGPGAGARALGWAAGGLLALAAAGAQAVEPGDFEVRTAQDLVELCSAVPPDPNAVEAIHFCHGFGSGAWNYHEAVHTGPEADPDFVCLPDPAPTRTEALAGFVRWAEQNPQHLQEPAVDALFRYLTESYPCPDVEPPLGGPR